MRHLTDHIVEGDSANHQLTITVLDEPGAGGANHEYRIAARYGKGEKSPQPLRGRMGDQTIKIESDGSFECTMERVVFQNGPIKEFGVNGITQEALLAIIIDRLRCFQAGPFSSPFNASALVHCEKALSDLQTRTRERIARGVEGTTKA
jgi:hypothetical protein